MHPSEGACSLTDRRLTLLSVTLFPETFYISAARLQSESGKRNPIFLAVSGGNLCLYCEMDKKKGRPALQLKVSAHSHPASCPLSHPKGEGQAGSAPRSPLYLSPGPGPQDPPSRPPGKPARELLALLGSELQGPTLRFPWAEAVLLTTPFYLTEEEHLPSAYLRHKRFEGLHLLQEAEQLPEHTGVGGPPGLVHQHLPCL